MENFEIIENDNKKIRIRKNICALNRNIIKYNQEFIYNRKIC